MGKITTIEINDNALAYIEVALGSRRFRHLKDFVNHCLNLAVTYTMDEWDLSRGVFYIHPCRICIIPADMLSGLLELIPDEAKKDAIESMTSCLRPRLRFWHISPKKPENRRRILRLLTLHGFGKFSLQDDVIEVSYPVLPHDVVQGVLEILLKVKLEIIECTKVMYVFRIVEELHSNNV